MNLCVRRDIRRLATCCDYCAKESDCPELAKRCRWTINGSCLGCPPCDKFEPRPGYPFRSAAEMMEVSG